MRRRKLVSLYLTAQEIAAIDAECEPYERNRWLREAIREKLARTLTPFTVTEYGPDQVPKSSTILAEDKGPYRTEGSTDGPAD